MKFLVDTNIVIDYYICSQVIDRETWSWSKYCASLRDFLVVDAKDSLISDLSMREFMLTY